MGGKQQQSSLRLALPDAAGVLLDAGYSDAILQSAWQER
ncbi:hypothetical protein RR42_m3671 [Cupriavidus basilensis]|uniref:Uncharacterized protein n=1 Tax=Cupriavidus basilensis TaxID=68895 RepID=A0A0C4YK61_9BURK|nr:hypothetical protein RR42_m3671 [Cupriavidus basilensis]